MTPGDPGFTEEAVNRQMDRLMATATYGPQPSRASKQTEIRVKGRSGRSASVAIVLDDVQAVIDELAADAACGICHRNPCAWRLSETPA